MKALITILACISFVMLFCTSENLLVQILISLSGITLFVISCKWIEKYCLTDNDKKERV